ncbi:MAG: hypothetical protein JW891_05110 [Candidatus Lokiarchaeota archaeon]|nr:hypothetical protein [Candidatus Lokiarchaeota archaeon]
MNHDLQEIEKKNLIIREQFDASDLMNRFPPKLFNHNKQLAFNIACPLGCVHIGKLTFSKWSQISWPEDLDKNGLTTQHLIDQNIYKYQSRFSDLNAIEWHMNFADRNLFGYYGGGLFAQDEMQVAEHPILGSLRECLLELESKDPKYGPYTRDVNASPTPILIRGAQRRIEISIDPDQSYGRPNGLYGKEFSNASEMAIKKATRVLSPPTMSNIIAMEAPKYGNGEYSLKTISEIFNTAHTAFLAARIESYIQDAKKNPVIVHTGNWGTGAYGGNKIIMALLQMLSATIAGIDYLVYHCFNEEDIKQYNETLKIFEKLISKKEFINIGSLLYEIERMNFTWGTSDGN